MVLLSLDNDIEELVPISRLEPTQTHTESFNFFNYLVLHIVFCLLLLLFLIQRYLQQTLLDQIIIVKGAAHLDAACLVVLLESNQLLTLSSRFVKHVRIEERTNVFVVPL